MILNYNSPAFLLHFAEVMEHKYRVLMGMEKDAKKFNFYSLQHRWYREMIIAISN